MIATGVLAAMQPAAVMAHPMPMMQMCTGEGVKLVPAPGHEKDRDKDCGQPCHALCQRKRAATGEESDCDNH